MATTLKQHDRMTISLPRGYSDAIKSLAAQLDLTQSDLIAKAFDAYREAQKKRHAEKMALAMADEYRQGSELVAFTALDGEDFR